MVIYSTQFGRESISTESKKLWNPVEDLKIINPDRACMTCLGHAPSQRRRCRNPISKSTRELITDIFGDIECRHPDNSTVRSRLRTVAELGLCYLHQNQAGTIVAQWQTKLQELELQIPERKPTKPVQNTRKQEVKQEDDVNDLREQVRELKEMLNQLRDEAKRQRQGSEGHEGPSVKDDDEEEECKSQRRRKEKERLEKDRLAKERLKKEHLEKERSERERKEREEKEQREREQAAQNERIRQRAQKRREDQEREKREREHREREEWDSLWTRYQERWVHFKSSASKEENFRDAVPWPVKSFSYSDVKASSVREFFQKATPRGANMSSLLRRECQKWHPDANMISRLLGGVELVGADKMLVDTICRVVTNLLDSA